MTFILSDCLPAFLDLPEHSLDAVVDDPPAGIGFMGRSWDKDRGGRAKWVAWLAMRKAAQLRVCKPGAYSLTWALPRTSHWTACALEDAGWLIRDVITHHFGQGWPKNGESQLKPASEHWILAQKPLGKGLTIRGNVERYGVGVLGIDACRIARGGPVLMPGGRVRSARQMDGMDDSLDLVAPKPGNHIGSWPTNVVFSHCPGCEEPGIRVVQGSAPASGPMLTGRSSSKARGRFNGVNGTPLYGESQEVPAFDCVASCVCGASVLHPSGGMAPRCTACGQQMDWACPVAELDSQSGVCKSGSRVEGVRSGVGYGGTLRGDGGPAIDGDEGGASRFFPTFHYSAKVSTAERDAGCEHLLWRRNKRNPFGFDRVTLEEWRKLDPSQRATGNTHPTVKSFALCKWLLSLVVPALPGYSEKRVIGDGFCGSGTIPIQAWLMGHASVAADVSPEALEIARARLNYWQGGLHVQPPARAVKKTTRKAPMQPAAQVRSIVPEEQASLFGNT